MGFPRKYDDVRERLTATVRDAEHANGCWIGTDVECKGGYQRQNWWVRGLQKHVKLTTHVLLWVQEHTGFTDMDDLYLAYLEFRASGLELDHTCDEPSCRCPSHLEPKTHRENMMDGRDRWAARRAAMPPVDDSEPEF